MYVCILFDRVRNSGAVRSFDSKSFISYVRFLEKLNENYSCKTTQKAWELDSCYF